MDKKSFLDELRNRLSFLPKDELERTLAYYNEMISDRIDAGMSEEEAVKAVGSIDEIVESVRTEGNYTTSSAVTDNTNVFAKVMLIVGLAALYFALVWDIILSVCFAVSAVGCLVASAVSAATLGTPAFLIFIGITLTLTSLFLATIPIASYIKFGIGRIKEAIRR